MWGIRRTRDSDRTVDRGASGHSGYDEGKFQSLGCMAAST
jgi:hypothetical protein